MRFGKFKIITHCVNSTAWFCQILIDDYCINQTTNCKTKNDAVYGAVLWLKSLLREAADEIKKPLFRKRDRVHATRWFGESMEEISECPGTLDVNTGEQQDGGTFYCGIPIKQGDWIVRLTEEEKIMSSEEFDAEFVVED